MDVPGCAAEQHEQRRDNSDTRATKVSARRVGKERHGKSVRKVLAIGRLHGAARDCVGEHISALRGRDVMVHGKLCRRPSMEVPTP